MTIGLGIALVLVIAFVLLKSRSKESPGVAQHEPPKVEGPKQHFLVATGGPLDGKSWHLGSRRVTVGRAPSNYIQINAPDVSRTAAHIDIKGGAPTVIDMNSSSGVYVNGTAVKTASFVDGDTVTIGGQQFVYHLEGDFAQNAAIDRKDAGREVAAATEEAGANNVLRAHAFYAQNKGDSEAAAKAMGISTKEFEELLKQLDV